MQLLLGKGTIHVYQTNMVPVQKVRLNILNKGLQDHDEMLVTFDGEKYIPFKQNMGIPKEYHALKKIMLMIKLQKKGKTINKFVADPIIAKTYILLGEDATKIFPNYINHMENRIKELEKNVNILAKTLKEIRDTGEII